MSDDAWAIVIIAATAVALLVFVLAPWRSPRRDALAGEHYYALLAGEDPPDETDGEAGEPEDDDESGPSAGDVAFP